MPNVCRYDTEIKNHFLGVNIKIGHCWNVKKIPAEKISRGGTDFLPKKTLNFGTFYVPGVCISIFMRQKFIEFKIYIIKTISYNIRTHRYFLIDPRSKTKWECPKNLTKFCPPPLQSGYETAFSRNVKEKSEKKITPFLENAGS